MAYSAHDGTPHQPFRIANDALLNIYEHLDYLDGLLSALITDQLQQVAADRGCDLLQSAPCGAWSGCQAITLTHSPEVVRSCSQAPELRDSMRVADEEALTDIRLLRRVQCELHVPLNAITCLLIEASLPVRSPSMT